MKPYIVIIEPDGNDVGHGVIEHKDLVEAWDSATEWRKLGREAYVAAVVTAPVKIDHAWHFAGEPSLPPAFRGDGPFELTLDQLAELMKQSAVLLYKLDDGKTVIAFDTHRGRFKQR